MKDTGGSAFSGKICTGHEPFGDIPIYAHPKGMTLRDYFAGQALISLVHGWATQSIDDYEPVILAVDAYMVADAMIKERSK